MPIIVNAQSRILIQGITGRSGRLYARRMLDDGTPVVGGTSPGKGGQMVEGLPVFDSVHRAVAATGATAVLCVVPKERALDAVIEAVDGNAKLIVLYTENVPVRDAIQMRDFARKRGAMLLGPNSAGVITPRQANLADINDLNTVVGRVGIVSKSGTLTYEVMDELHRVGLGESSIVCLGGDSVVGTTYGDILPLFDKDPDTDCIVVLGEPGGMQEYEVARLAPTLSKPVVAYITARHAPQEKRMGHAGAISGASAHLTTAEAKRKALLEAGCAVAGLVTDIGDLVQETLASATAVA